MSSSQQTGTYPPVPEFSAAQRRVLLCIAHEAILSVLERRPFKDEAPADATLSEPRGVFTTLYLRDLRAHPTAGPEPQLRGCVGYALPVAPLYHAVAQTARAAAFEDSRFPPVTLDEALQLEVSLSVLSRLFPILPEAVEVGRHGLLVSARGRRGLLLPQVPTEHGWNRETFLEQTCRKAGLPLDSWRMGATVEAFTAEVFSTPTPPNPASRPANRAV
jgi:AmmeMemoRadiSam system protein A